MTELSDYKRLVSDPHERRLSNKIRVANGLLREAFPHVDPALAHRIDQFLNPPPPAPAPPVDNVGTCVPTARPKLTSAQRDALERAHKWGGAYANLPMTRRKGGAYRRMVERLTEAGLLEDHFNGWRITAAGREALGQPITGDAP